MTFSRGSWAALALLTLLQLPLSPEVAASTETRPWFQSSSPASAIATRQLLARASRPMRFSGAKLSQIDAFQSHKAPALLRMLVVGCDFSDSLLWGRDRSQFVGWPAPARQGNFLFNDEGKAITDAQGNPIYEFAAHDSTYFDLQMRKTADYFTTVSQGTFDLQWQALSTLVNLPEPMGYYGADQDNNDRLVEMAKAVVEAVDSEVDFSSFDTLVLVHAGAGRETDINNDSPQQLFSNYLDRRDFEQAMADTVLSEPGIPTQDGVLIRHVLILPESETQDPVVSLGLNGFFGMRGVYCFEVGLRLGMLSLADFTPSGRPDSQGIGNYGLMGYGLFTGLGIVPAEPCAMNRMLMGWVDAVEIDSDSARRIASHRNRSGRHASGQGAHHRPRVFPPRVSPAGSRRELHLHFRRPQRKSGARFLRRGQRQSIGIFSMDSRARPSIPPPTPGRAPRGRSGISS